MTQKSVAQNVRDKTQAARHAKLEHDREQLQVYAEERDRIFAMVKRNISVTFEEDFLPKIEKAAEEGLSEAFLPVGDFRGKAGPPAVKTQALLLHGIEYLCEHGFQAKEKVEYSPRIGSDDDYGDRTDVWIHVSW